MTSFDADGICFSKIDATVFSLRTGEQPYFFSIAFGEVVLGQFLEDNIIVLPVQPQRHRRCR